MSNSSLVSYTKISPNKTSPRNHTIDTITIHCYVGQASVESMGGWLGNPSAQASANYGIGVDGRIGLFVEEKDRSWCSSSSSNDNRAITIECASDKTEPYAINDKVYNSLIKLCADICKRNNIKELKWKADPSLIGQVDKQNMTVHRWFKNKSCPGEYIYSRLGKIASEVNTLLGVSGGTTTPSKPSSGNDSATGSSVAIPKTPFQVNVLIDDLNYRSEPSMKGDALGCTGEGVFTIIEVSDGWGKLKSGAGWSYLGNPNYCKILKTTETSASTGFKGFSVRVNTKKLRIRKGPGTNYDWTGLYTGIGTFTIVAEENGWGKLKSGAGWISLGYTVRV